MARSSSSAGMLRDLQEFGVAEYGRESRIVPGHAGRAPIGLLLPDACQDHRVAPGQGPDHAGLLQLRAGRERAHGGHPQTRPGRGPRAPP